MVMMIALIEAGKDDKMIERFYLFKKALFICLVFIFAVFVCFSDSSFRSQLLFQSGSPNVVDNTKYVHDIVLIQESI